ncbi:hypothetical protein sS8_1187 [Methylocaldum marinum]|uniref:Uncharacterized protein n=1 Tax=Methylocaldum marinum TaxID=1432792 RepID=A0A250KTN7_9GAMM|nr:hypothetical protein sS8_1187 [Methylocaldum marinum]
MGFYPYVLGYIIVIYKPCIMGLNMKLIGAFILLTSDEFQLVQYPNAPRVRPGNSCPISSSNKSDIACYYLGCPNGLGGISHFGNW